MTKRKVLVEYELDPTEYTGYGDSVLEDTQESAQLLVQEMHKGNVDICDSRIIGGLVLLFRGRVTPPPATQQILDSFSAIAATLANFRQKQPLTMVRDQVSITCLQPTSNRPYYEVSVWRQPSSIQIATATEPDV